MLASVVASAGPILTYPINGSISLDGLGLSIAVNATDIDFDYSGATVLSPAPGATGVPVAANCPGVSCTVDGNGDSALFSVTAGTGSFTGLGGNITVADLNVITEPVGNTNPADDLSHFITFSSNGWTITLTDLEPGTGSAANCAGGNLDCTPPGSPFNLTNENGNVEASLTFLGTFFDTADGLSGAVTGTYSTSFSGVSVQNILAALGSGEAVVGGAQGSLAITSTPEPGTASMMLLAGAGLFLLSRIRRNKANR
jgi:hypothetical protein